MPSRDVPPRAPRSPRKGPFLDYRPSVSGLRAIPLSSMVPAARSSPDRMVSGGAHLSDDEGPSIRPRSSDLSDITEHRAYHNESSFRNDRPVDFSLQDSTPESTESTDYNDASGRGSDPLFSHPPPPDYLDDDDDDDVDVSVDVDVVDDEDEDFSLSDGEAGGEETHSRPMSCNSSIDTHEGLCIDDDADERNSGIVNVVDVDVVDDGVEMDVVDVDDDDQSFASTSVSTVKNDSDRDETARVARHETRVVRCLRPVIISTLVVLGIVLSTAFWHVALEAEKKHFEEDFTDYASSVTSAFSKRVGNAAAALDSLSFQVTASADPVSWPEVTVDDFHLRVASAKLLADSLASVMMLPLVEEGERLSFEGYARANSGWLDEVASYQLRAGGSETATGSGRRELRTNSFNFFAATDELDFDDGMASTIYRFDDLTPLPESGAGPFYPIRHASPLAHAAAINYNAASNTYISGPSSEAFVLGRMVSAAGKDDYDATVMRSLLYSADLSSADAAVSVATYPIFDSTSTERKPVGVMASLLDWKKLFDHVLPASDTSIVCVVQNSCGQQVSLLVEGPTVEFIGDGDHHDTNFDDDAVNFDLTELDLSRTTMQVPFGIGESECRYSLRIYPTAQFRDRYSTGMPVLLAVTTAVVFFLVTIVFVAYDCVVERRQRVVLKSAMEARAIVSSLFPAVVRDRLFQNNRDKQERKNRRARQRELMKQVAPLMEQPTLSESPAKVMSHIDVPHGSADPSSPHSPLVHDTEHAQPTTPSSIHHILGGLMATPGAPEETTGAPSTPLHRSSSAVKSNRRSMVQHPKHRLKSFLQHGSSTSVDDNDELGLGLAKPIADLFPHTTVLFADIAGFTAWSSEREPEQVFTLLQTIYHAFDKIAKRRSVFKVETIGDCYVAVTGLPEEQPDHAVRMTKFARECMTRMNEVTKRLEVALGPDTGDLCMRLGLHSGPVTAGVLQGEKSRFQLFGDTVNTASRMESTGERNRIQVSQATADLLIAAGKENWVRPREDVVQAKGKGEIQTYWIVGRNGSMPLAARHSTSGILHDMARKAPARSRSAMPRAGPIRKSVTRATSDTVSKLSKMSKSASMSVSSTQSASSTSSAGKVIEDAKEKRVDRLVDWQVEIFARLLKKIVAARGDSGKSIDSMSWSTHSEVSSSSPLMDRSNKPQAPLGAGSKTLQSPGPRRSSGSQEFEPRSQMNARSLARAPSFRLPTRRPSIGIDIEEEIEFELCEPSSKDTIVMDEVAEVITLPKFDARATKTLTNPDSIKLPPSVLTQLHDFIKTISMMYRDNPFHNFEHASHVTMSANKLLNRIVIPENVDYQRESKAIASDLHDYTYGITSDPLTHFAVIFSALIHDVDHAGVPNGRLAEENPEMAKKYRNQSIAEQNSVDLAWELLTSDRFQDLQACIYTNDEERDRFRQLIVNSVMATDIFDKDMKALRNKRWDKAFHRDANVNCDAVDIDEDINMKATIVIEHIIQASDVAHTMQHWHIYQKWNERLFEEMYAAYESGRSDKDPTKGWYKGEIWFFDNYVIPLAKKLEECNVFGVASDECLSFAIANRNEWSIKGESIVLEMVSRFQKRKFMSQLGLGRVPSRTKSRSNHQA